MAKVRERLDGPAGARPGDERGERRPALVARVVKLVRKDLAALTGDQS
ncbi:MAG: hypothetical protein IRY85_19790 [Micromonosporaceae bacterium]|nr:hypothetical protein [Micromonosporaceae bacterium]